MQDAYLNCTSAVMRIRWRSGIRELVGGLYGLAMGQLFFGESMFSRADNASKYGFATLVQHLKEAGFVLIDCQMPTDHLHSLGARAIPRHEFANYLARHLTNPVAPPGFAERLCARGLHLIHQLIPRVDHDRVGALEVLCHSASFLQLSARGAGDDAVPRPEPAHGCARLRRPVGNGLRRSGDHLYRPHCQNCNACVPARIPVAQFNPNRQQKRIFKRNADLQVRPVKPHFSEEYFDLYQRYIEQRHADGDMYRQAATSSRPFWCATCPSRASMNFASTDGYSPLL
jgi:hypothetical protein